tara:strand:- start:730 stop:1500 length:771 start_codon:yes stop_codon:yes gene_type:complete
MYPMMINRKKKKQTFYPRARTLILGHRGAPTQRTENTLPSFQKAIIQGVDGIEFDVRQSKEGRLIIFHDTDLKRLANQNKKIKELSFTELKKIKLNKTKNQKEEAYIPSLDDIIPILEHIKVINIEIKSESLLRGQGMLKPIIQFLDKHKIDDRCIISSFNPLFLMRLRLKRPQTIIGFLYNRNTWFHGWNNMIWMLRIKPDNLHIHHSLLNHWIVKWAQNKGMKVNAYTINNKEVYNNYKSKIDGVFTDNIEYLK